MHKFICLLWMVHAVGLHRLLQEMTGEKLASFVDLLQNKIWGPDVYFILRWKWITTWKQMCQYSNIAFQQVHWVYATKTDQENSLLPNMFSSFLPPSLQYPYKIQLAVAFHDLSIWHIVKNTYFHLWFHCTCCTHLYHSFWERYNSNQFLQSC
jgi:hypothetical protein